MQAYPGPVDTIQGPSTNALRAGLYPQVATEEQKLAIVKRERKRSLLNLLMNLYREVESTHGMGSAMFGAVPEVDDTIEEVKLFLAQKLVEALPKGGKQP